MGSARPSRSCAFCGGDSHAHGGRLGKLEGPFNVSKTTFEIVYVHTQCAVWSPNISQNVDLTLRSVGKEVRRARTLRCSSCGRSGAATGCRVPSCGRCYHLPCAINQSCCFNFELYLMSCPEHSALFKREPAGQAAERPRGPLSHLKLSGRPHQQHKYPAIASAAACRPGRGLKRRNKMTAAQLGDHIDAVKAAYKSLVEELDGQDGSEPDEAIIAAKDAKRLKKATQQLAPTLLGHRPAAATAPTWGSPVGQHPAVPPLIAAAAGHAQARHKQPPRLPLQLLSRRQPLQQQGVPVQLEKPCQPPAAGFANIGGLADVKRQLKEMVLMPLMYPEVMQQLGIQPPRGILLHGPPGCGKTAIVRALAAECAVVSSQASSGAPGTKPVALFARKGTDCLGKYAGDAELHLRLLFDMAAAAAPSIIFLDELDGLVPARSVRSSSSDQIFASIVSVMLALLDGIKDRGQVLIIGATNRPDSIDPALRRPGRFDREVYFNLPTQQDRQDILTVQTRSWPQQQQLRPELLQQLAAATDGWAGADLQSLTAGALLSAVKRSAPQLISAIDQGQHRHHHHHHHQQQQPAAKFQQQRQHGQLQVPHNNQQNHQQKPAQQQRPDQHSAALNQQHTGTAVRTIPCSTAAPADAANADTAATARQQQQGVKQGPSGRSSSQLMSIAPSIPAAAAGADGGAGGSPKATGGFLAALSSFMSEQQQQQQQSSWFAPLQARGSRSPGVPASVVAEAEAIAATRRSPLATARSSPAPTLPTERSDGVLTGGTTSPVSLRAENSPVQIKAPPTSAAEAGVPGDKARTCSEDLHDLNSSSDLQQQRSVQHRHLLTKQCVDVSKQGAQAAGPRQQQQQQLQQVALQLADPGDPGTGQGASTHLQQQQQGNAAADPEPESNLRPSEGQTPVSDIQVLPCDWLAALAAAGAPASKREMSSLAALNPAEPLPAVLTPLLLLALAQVVLLLHRWLLLPTDELAAAAAVVSGCSSSCSDVQSCVLGLGLEQLLVQCGVVEQMTALTTPAADGVQGPAKQHSLIGPDTSSSCPNRCAAVEGRENTSNRSTPSTVGTCPRDLFPSAASRACSRASLFSNRSSCYRLLLSGHGVAGQRELAAAVLKLLGSAAAAAAVHTVSLPGLLLLGGGDVGKGLVASVQDAVGRTGRGQLLVLYVPRIELWALEPGKHKRSPSHAAAKKSNKTSASHVNSVHGAWNSNSGALHGIMSSSGSSDGSSSSDGDDSDDSNLEDQMNTQLDPNNALGTPVRSAAAGAANRTISRSSCPARIRNSQQQQDQRLSSAWGVFEQQLAVMPTGDQCVLLLATSHLPAEVLPYEVQQVFGAQQDFKQHHHQQQQQQQHSSKHRLHGIGSQYYTAGMQGSVTSSSLAATVQTCGCGSGVGAGAEAEAALQAALDRAGAVAAQQFRHQLMHACSISKSTCDHHHQQQQQGDRHQAVGRGRLKLQGWLGRQQGCTDVGQADVVQQQQQQESQQQQQQLALQQLNDAQQAQAKRLFVLVQQQLRMLGSLLLQDASLRQAVIKQPKRSSKAAKAKHQQQQWQEVLPLVDVCLKAVRGWYPTLDDFQADFAAAVDDVRRAHASEQAYSKAVSAAARLQDIAGAACREAARQLHLYDPNSIKLLQAAAQASKGTSQQQQQQCVGQIVLGQPPDTSAAAYDDAEARQSAAEADVASSSGCGHVAVDSTAAPEQVQAEATTQQHLRDEQEQKLQTALQGLAAEHMQRWRQSQGQRDSRDEFPAGRSICWAGLHAAAQQYRRATACRVSLALEQAVKRQRHYSA